MEMPKNIRRHSIPADISDRKEKIAEKAFGFAAGAAGGNI